MAENVRQLSVGVYCLDLDLLVVFDVDRVLDTERLIKTSPVVLKREKPLVDKKVSIEVISKKSQGIFMRP